MPLVFCFMPVPYSPPLIFLLKIQYNTPFQGIWSICFIFPLLTIWVNEYFLDFLYGDFTLHGHHQTKNCLPLFINFTLSANVRENWRDNQERTIQRHRQHWAQDSEWRQTKQKTHHRKLKRWATQIPQQNQSEPKYSRRESSSCFIEDTRHVPHTVKSGKSLVSDRGKK